MRSLAVRQRLVRVAAAGASALLLATACTGKKEDGPDGTVGVAGYKSGTLLLSDGTETVLIGDETVTFPTKVTDATWSPDGSRVAFVNGEGNIASARYDGTGLLVHTAATPGAVRSRPTWSGAYIMFAEKRPDGTSYLQYALANRGLSASLPEVKEPPHETGDGTGYIDLAPSSSVRTNLGWLYAYQHDEPSGPEVWIADSTQRTPVDIKLAAGSEPAMSPDASKVAFVGANGQVFVTNRPTYQQPANTVQITFGANKPTHLAWLPDGAHLAFQTPTDVESVGIQVAAGASSNPTQQLSAKPGTPSFLGTGAEKIGRVSSVDPIEQAVAVSQSHWPTSPQYMASQGYRGAFSAVITTPANAPTVRAASRPLLLTSGASLDPRTAAELKRLFGIINPAMGGRPSLTVVGGTGVISAGVENALTSMGFEVDRVASLNSADDDGETPTGQPLSVVVVEKSSPTDLAFARTLLHDASNLVLVDGNAGIDASVRDWLARSSASIDTVLFIDSGAKIGEDLEREIAGLVTGPLGYQTTLNPTVPALAPLS